MVDFGERPTVTCTLTKGPPRSSGEAAGSVGQEPEGTRHPCVRRRIRPQRGRQRPFGVAVDLPGRARRSVLRDEGSRGLPRDHVRAGVPHRATAVLEKVRTGELPPSATRNFGVNSSLVVDRQAGSHHARRGVAAPRRHRARRSGRDRRCDHVPAGVAGVALRHDPRRGRRGPAGARLGRCDRRRRRRGAGMSAADPTRSTTSR